MRGQMVLGSKFGGNETQGPTTFADSEDMNVQSRYNVVSSGGSGGGGLGMGNTLAKHQSATGKPGGAMMGQHEMKNLLQSQSSG